jgi:hypothetical protein
LELYVNDLADYVVHVHSFLGQDAEERERPFYLLGNVVELCHLHNEDLEKDIP